ncbi:MAG: hypothetical protein ACOY81_06690 [Bacillota bacterium]
MNHQELIQDLFALTGQAIEALQQDDFDGLIDVLEKRQHVLDFLAELGEYSGGVSAREQITQKVLNLDRQLLQLAESKLVSLQRQWQICRQARRALDSYRQPRLQLSGVFVEKKQ